MLTKSLYMHGWQCPKYMWISSKNPSLLPAIDAASKMRMEQGIMIGKYAHSLYPSGIHVRDLDPERNASVTAKMLEQRVPLFEAGFISEGIYSRADILVPAGEDEWDIVEVKSSASVKDEHLVDLSFQRYCCAKAGLKVRSCFIMHIDNSYVRQGGIDVRKLFRLEDVSSQLDLESIASSVPSFLSVLDSVCPSVPVGLRCSSPRECPLVPYCWKEIPADNVFCLHRDVRHLASELYSSGIVRLKDIPADFILSDKQNIQRVCANTGKPHIERPWLRRFLSSIKPPVQYVDFEAFNTAVPVFDGTRPYQQVPFQFSLHIDDGGKVSHSGFLASGSSDPRPDFIEALQRSVLPSGSIVVYNRVFELGVLESLAVQFPSCRAFVDSVSSRVVDLLEVFKNFHYYCSEQCGSASIKSVLPALVGKGYDSLDGISEGEAASLAFMKLMDGSLDDSVREDLRKQLEAYCGLDTEAMLLIVKKLSELSR